MTTEAQKPQGEQPGIDTVQTARSAFNRELFSRDYHTGALLVKTIQLQNVLLGSSLSPERIYHELSIVSGQGAERAELLEDSETVTTLRELQKGFQLTYETFRPGLESARSTHPTRTETLPPMTSAKGGEARLQTPVQSEIKENETRITSEVSTESQTEQAETDKTQNPQQPQKKRGRPQKSTQE